MLGRLRTSELPARSAEGGASDKAKDFGDWARAPKNTARKPRSSLFRAFVFSGLLRPIVKNGASDQDRQTSDEPEQELTSQIGPT
jgi:hypothetical protein